MSEKTPDLTGEEPLTLWERLSTQEDSMLTSPQKPPLSFSEWDSQIGSGITDQLDKYKSFADYNRSYWFSNDQLDENVESNIYSSLLEQVSQEGLIDSETLQDPRKTQDALRTQSISDEQEAALITRAYGENVASTWLDSKRSGEGDVEVINKTLNDAKTYLVDTGQLPFAGIYGLEGERRVIGGDSSVDKVTALNNSVSAGAINFSDAYLVQRGLKSSATTGSSYFKLQQKARLSNELGLLIDPDKGGRAPQSLFKKFSNLLLAESRGDSKVDADVIQGRLVNYTRDYLVNKFRESLAEEYIKGRDISKEAALARFSKKAITDILEETAAQQLNFDNKFEYFEDKEDEFKNIRIFGSGFAVAHPMLMMQPMVFEQTIVADKRLNDDQRNQLRNSREYYRSVMYDRYAKLLSESSATSEKWTNALAGGVQQGKEKVDILDEFLADEDNYSAFKNQSSAILSSIGEAFSMLYNVPAAMIFESEAAAKRLAENQREASDRRELASIFGQDFGLGMDISTTVAPMLVDIGATALLSSFTLGAGGAAYIGAKTGTRLTAKGFAQGIAGGILRSSGVEATKFGAKREALDQASDLLADKLVSSVSRKNTAEAILTYNKIVNNKLLMGSITNTSLFLTAANRSGGSMFTTIYSSLPDSMSHEEKYDAAIGSAMLAGAVTGLITLGFGAIGRGGFEDAFLKGMTYRQTKGVVKRMLKVQFGREATDKAVRNIITALTKRSLGSRLAQSPVLKGFVDEAMEEGLDDFIQSFISDAALDEDTPLLEKAKNAFHSALVGGIIGAGASKGRSIVDNLRGGTANEARYRAQLADDVIAKLREEGSPLTADEFAARETRRQLTAPEREAERRIPLPAEPTVDQQEFDFVEDVAPREPDQFQALPEEAEEDVITQEEFPFDARVYESNQLVFDFIEQADELVTPEAVEEALTEQLEFDLGIDGEADSGTAGNAARSRTKTKKVIPDVDDRVGDTINKLNQNKSYFEGEDYMFPTASTPLAKTEFIDDELTAAEVRSFEQLVSNGVVVDLTRDRTIHGMPDRKVFPKDYYEKKTQLLKELIAVRYPKVTTFLRLGRPVKDADGSVIGYTDKDGVGTVSYTHLPLPTTPYV